MLEEERLYAIFDAPLWQGTTFKVWDTITQSPHIKQY